MLDGKQRTADALRARGSHGLARAFSKLRQRSSNGIHKAGASSRGDKKAGAS
jgi:hypothetical protein